MGIKRETKREKLLPELNFFVPGEQLLESFQLSQNVKREQKNILCLNDEIETWQYEASEKIPNFLFFYNS